MDKRIKIVWYLSVTTILLIFVGQAYWIYSQYQYAGDMLAEQMKRECTTAIKDEQGIREVRRMKETEKDNRFNKIRIASKSVNKNANESNRILDVTYTLGDNTRYFIRVKGLSNDELSMILDRYIIACFKPIQAQTIDSVMASKGYASMRDFRTIRKEGVVMLPQYEVTTGLRKMLKVAYCSNPLRKEAVTFAIPIPVNTIIKTLTWQLGASLLLLLVLAFCLYYQIKTIMIQKRIDAMRHEFMKNMIFEMKQPVEPNAAEDVLRIGDTDFRYSMNELQHESERVMLTSRQAEIFKILSDSPNRIVPREQILLAAWGDDSYSNSMALNVQISYLRRAIRSDERLAIEVVYKKGYILNVKEKVCRQS